MSQFDTFPDCFELNLLDIGAAGGIHERWGSPANPNLSVIMVEPEPKALAELAGSGTRIRTVAAALSSQDGTRLLRVARKGQCSSVHPRNFAFVNRFPGKERFEIIGEEEVRMQTLDSMCEEIGVSTIDFIKIDVEGHENEVIAGGGAWFRNAIGIEAEMIFAPLFEGGAQFCDQHKAYTGMGFDLFDLQRYYWKRDEGRQLPSPGQLIYCNGLYLKTPESVMTETPGDARRVCAALRIYWSFGYLDLVQTLSRLATDGGLLTARQSAMIASCLAARRFARPQDVRAGLLHRLLMKGSRILAGIARAVEPAEQERSHYRSDQTLGHW